MAFHQHSSTTQLMRTWTEQTIADIMLAAADCGRWAERSCGAVNVMRVGEDSRNQFLEIL